MKTSAVCTFRHGIPEGDQHSGTGRKSQSLPCRTAQHGDYATGSKCSTEADAQCNSGTRRQNQLNQQAHLVSVMLLFYDPFGFFSFAVPVIKSICNSVGVNKCYQPVEHPVKEGRHGFLSTTIQPGLLHQNIFCNACYKALVVIFRFSG